MTYSAKELRACHKLIHLWGSTKKKIDKLEKKRKLSEAENKKLETLKTDLIIQEKALEAYDDLVPVLKASMK